MVFIRTKNIKGKEYAYLVENTWTKQGPRQKTKKYLGRVHVFSREKEILFNEFFPQYQLELRSKKDLIKDAIKLELTNHGFVLGEDKKWSKNDCFADINALKFTSKSGKNIALGMNEGILCKELISNILNLRIEPDSETQDKEGYTLAKLLVESGLKVSSEIFVRLYELTKADN